MATNKSFGKITAGGGLEYAQTFVQLDGRIVINPSRDEYLRAGWLEIADSTPSPPDGHHLARTGYEVRDGLIFAVYEYAADEKVPRVFSKLRCYSALKAAGYWDEVKAWLETADLWDAFVLAQNVSEDHPQFVQGLAKMQELLGISDEQAEAILSGCVEG